MPQGRVRRELPLARIKAVLFDLDGVLVDAREWHFEALNEALRGFGILLGRSEHEAEFDGLPTRVKLDILTRQGRLAAESHPLILQTKQAHTRRLILDRCRPDPDKVRLLRLLKERGFVLGVCSNSTRETLRLILDRAALAEFFECALSAEDVARPKPAPDIYVEAFARLGLEPDAALIIEDGAYGVESARRAGGRLLKVESPAEVTGERLGSFIEASEGRGMSP